MNARVERLRQLGFQDVGRFQIIQSPDTYLWAFVKPPVGVTAVWSKHTGGFTGFEMATHYARSSFALVSGPLAALGIDPPGWTIRRVIDTDEAMMHERMLTERPAKPVDGDDVDDFASRFQERWARIQDWRNLRGGYTEDEIRAISAARGLDPTQEMIAEGRKSVAKQALLGVEVILQEQFFSEAELTDREAEAILPWMAIVHDRLDFDMLVQLFTRRWLSAFGTVIPERCPVAEEIRAMGKPPREAFSMLNDHMPGQRFQLTGRVTQPVAADVYIAHDGPLPARLRSVAAPQ
jgi:hypothetical protein